MAKRDWSALGLLRATDRFSSGDVTAASLAPLLRTEVSETSVERSTIGDRQCASTASCRMAYDDRQSDAQRCKRTRAVRLSRPKASHFSLQYTLTSLLCRPGARGLRRRSPSSIRSDEYLGDVKRVVVSDVSGRGGKKVIPYGETGAPQLSKSFGAGKEEDVEVRSTITPSRHVRARNVRQRFNGPRGMYDEPPELCGEVVRQIGQVVVIFRQQHHDEGCPRRL